MRDDMGAGAIASTTTARQEMESALAPLAAMIAEGRRIALGMTVFAAALALLSTL